MQVLKGPRETDHVSVLEGALGVAGRSVKEDRPIGVVGEKSPETLDMYQGINVLAAQDMAFICGPNTHQPTPWEGPAISRIHLYVLSLSHGQAYNNSVTTSDYKD